MIRCLAADQGGSCLLSQLWKLPRVGAVIPGSTRHGCAFSHLALLQFPDGGVGTALQHLQRGLELLPLPLRHHSGVNDLRESGVSPLPQPRRKDDEPGRPTLRTSAGQLEGEGGPDLSETSYVLRQAMGLWQVPDAPA